MKDMLIKMQNVTFNNFITYPDFEIFKNEVTFIVGESGIGKSTLLKLFNQTLTQSSGEIFYNEKNIIMIHPIELRKEISLIGQGAFLFDSSVKENFKNFYDFREEPILEDAKIKYYLNLCCIDVNLDKNCTTMSGGERQRVYMAIFLSFNPKVIMLDEPTAALDTRNSNEVIGNVIAYCKEKGITVIIVSHDNELTEKFAENIIVIEKKAE